MADLDNCSRCGVLFVRTTQSICQECRKEEEKQFQIVYNFMKKRANRQATIPEIVESTGVKEDLIFKFVKEKRLRSSQFPNLSYPCDRCGKEIMEGNLCTSCSNELSGDLKRQESIEAENRRKEEERNRTQTYFAVDKGKKR